MYYRIHQAQKLRAKHFKLPTYLIFRVNQEIRFSETFSSSALDILSRVAREHIRPTLVICERSKRFQTSAPLAILKDVKSTQATVFIKKVRDRANMYEDKSV